MDFKVPYYQHDLGQAELDAVAKVLSGPILTTGEVTAEFEYRFAALLGRRHAIGTKSCTSALQLTLTALGIGPGDEVITTPMNWVATAAAILHTGAKVVFADVEPDTGNLDVAKVASAITSRTRAVVPVHLFGLMCDMRALSTLAKRNRLRLVEDAAHCIEGERDGVRPGQLSDAACFSFYATKNMTCGEGGAVVCDDDQLDASLRLLRLHGATGSAAERSCNGHKPWDVVALGYKENMGNVEAALLLPQFERLARNLARREHLAERYISALRTMPGIGIPASRPGAVHARHVFPIWVNAIPREQFIVSLQDRRIGCVVHQTVHLRSYFVKRFGFRGGDFPVAEHIGDRTVSLPFYPNMPPGDVDIVADAIALALSESVN
jgi:UDP-4-amino-4-deoxy-L-arabinose-oxoglutarate aminotransferase